MRCGPVKKRTSILWCPPPYGVLKFNMDSATKGKPGLTRIGGVLHNSRGEVLLMFSKHVLCVTPMKQRCWPF